MTPVLAPSVHCKNPNCLSASQPILLPFPNPPGVFERQSGWPTDTWKAYIACFECGLVYEYLAQDVRWGVHDSQFLNQLQIHQAFYELEIECAGKGCELPIRIHVYTGSGTTIGGVIEKLLEGNFRALRCPSGHSPPEKKFSFGQRNVSGPIESR